MKRYWIIAGWFIGVESRSYQKLIGEGDCGK